MSNILIVDSTLRDGNHAVRHQLDSKAISSYAMRAEKAGVPVVVVGHGNGIGASSLQVGESLLSDEEMITTARIYLKKSKLGVFFLPGFATIQRDLAPAFENGVDVVCIGSHCTETDLTKRYIEYARYKGKTAYSNIMMVHMIPTKQLVEECLKSQAYGAEGITLMDSSGALTPDDVTEKITALVNALDIPVGFHAHNNLGLAIANSIAAAKAGAKIMDCCTLGFGAGAGNAQLEGLVAVLHKLGFSTGVDLYEVLDLADFAKNCFVKEVPMISSVSIVSGLSGVFSGFSNHALRAAAQYKVDVRDIFFELGRRRVVAGQEDLIVEVAMKLACSTSDS